MFIRNHLSDSLPDFEICFHVSETTFAISEVSFHVVWGRALAYLLFFSLNTLTKFMFTKKVDTSYYSAVHRVTCFLYSLFFFLS